MTDERTGVLIVGGGLVGLATSLFLSWHGVPSVLVERHAGTSTHPRARGVNARTMELFRSVGLEPAVRAAPSARTLAANSGIVAVQTLAGPELGSLRQPYFADTSVDLSALSPCDWCLCDQDELEPILRRRAEQLGGDVRFGVELHAWRQDEGGVSAVVTDMGTGGTRSIDAHHLVAADGAASPVRQRLGIALRGPGTLARFRNILFHADLRPVLGDRRFLLCYVVNPAVMGALVPVDNAHRWLLHVLLPPGQDPDELPDDTRCAELVRAAVGLPGVDVDVQGVLPWKSAGQWAERLSAGRVFLVGDAAHTMPPTGALGSNTGIQDAHNLAWKLAAVHRGTAGPQLLGDYAAERLPIAEATVGQAVLRSQDRPRLAAADAPDGGPPAHPGIRPDAQVHFAYRYRSGAVLGADDDHEVFAPACDGRPGTRAPHVVLQRGDDRLSTLDLLGRGWVLLAGPDGHAWAVAAGEVAGDLGLDLVAHRVGGGDLTDVDGEWCTRCGIASDGALLVRPDGFVAWRAAVAGRDVAAALREALAQLLHPPRHRTPR